MKFKFGGFKKKDANNKQGATDGTKTKGGFNTTSTILTSAGVIAVGSAAAAMGYYAGKKDPENQMTEGNVTANNITESPQQGHASQRANPSQHATPSQQGNASPAGNNVQNAYNDSYQDNSQINPEPTTELISEAQPEHFDFDNLNVDPDQIAHELVDQKIDSRDIDAPDILTFDGVAQVHGDNGAKMDVAVCHTPDGTQFMLADVDGDGFYTDVFSTDGDYVGQAAGNLMASDIVEQLDNSGGYLAYVDDNMHVGDPSSDIIDTDYLNPDNSNLIAQNETQDADPTADATVAAGVAGTAQIADSSDNSEVAANVVDFPEIDENEELSDDELLAQLLDDDSDDELLVDLTEDDSDDSESSESTEDASDDYETSEDDEDDDDYSDTPLIDDSSEAYDTETPQP